MPTLTPKQTRFVQEFLIDLNATKAAIRAGYSAHTAAEQSSRLLTNAKIAEAIHAAQAETAERLGYSKDLLLKTLWINHLVAFDGNPVLDRDGKPTGRVMRQISASNRALELIAKITGLVDRPRVEAMPQTVYINTGIDRSQTGE